ncbi:MAG: sulfatase [Bacteroidales bacterium]
MKLLIPLAFLCVVLLFGCQPKETTPPNVLFICIDDLNDWTGFLGGHPDAKTPRLDQLASESVVFSRAYCPAPACNPSRASILTGIRPSTSGVYLNPQPWRNSPVLENILTMPQYFREHGYIVKGSGKTFHGSFPDSASWDEYWPSFTQQKPADPMPENRPINGIPNTAHFDWGPVNASKEEMGDWQVADWVIDQLGKDYDKPFFLACGFFRPHLPWFVPQEYFDRFPLDGISLPVVKENDTADIPEAGKALIKFRDHENVTKYNQWTRAVQGYLASGNFVDECVGRVVDALENSEFKDNTIIVLWSDHGWNLGEKQHWRKFALWENTTRTLFMVKAPGISGDGSVCSSPVNLLDVYPTLVELCGLPPNLKNEGTSVVPLLKSADQSWEVPSVTTYGKDKHAVRLRNWRYIQYDDGSEELYNLEKDPNEWTNLAQDPEYESIITELKNHLPALNAESIPKN